MMANRYCVIEEATGIVTSAVIWDGIAEWAPPEGYIAVASDVASPGWTYVNGEFIEPPVIPPTPEEILARQSAFLQGYTQLAASQKTALTNRIGTILDAIDLEMATPEEEAELPVRQAQLTAWKKYAVLLGRVTAQPDWPETVVWPAQPADGMDLSVSAVAARPASAQ